MLYGLCYMLFYEVAYRLTGLILEVLAALKTIIATPKKQKTIIRIYSVNWFID